MANKSKYAELAEKFRNMKTNRQKYNTVDINNFIPSIYDMLQEDCVIDILEDVSNTIGHQDEVLDVAYYSCNPFQTNAGYYSDYDAFVLDVNSIANSKGCWELNTYDGDTLEFFLDDLDIGGSFTFNGSTYNDYSDYVKRQCLGDEDGDRTKIALRFAGIDAAEIPHYGIALQYKDEKIETYTLKTLKEMKASGKDCIFLPFTINKNKSEDPSK